MSINKQQYEKIMILFDQSKYESIIKLEDQITNYKYNSDLYEALAWSYMRKEKYEKAIELFNISISHDKKSFRANYGLGNSYFRIENFSLAEKYFKIFLKIGKDISSKLNIEVLVNLGVSCLHQGKFKKAINYYLKALEINKEDVDILNNIGMAFYYLKNYTDALKYFEKAIYINPNDIDIQNKITKTKEILISEGK